MKTRILLLLILIFISTTGMTCVPHHLYWSALNIPKDRDQCEGKGNRYGTKSHSDCIDELEKVHQTKLNFYRDQCKKEGHKPFNNQFIDCMNEAIEHDETKIINSKK
jgi:hypothetical protein